MSQFDLISLNDNDEQDWQITRHAGRYDGLTAATITSVAVIRTVRNAALWYQTNKESILHTVETQ